MQVCHRWLQLCSLPELWRAHCGELGKREEVGDLASAVETTRLSIGGGSVEGEREKAGKGGVVIDWKRAYRDLSKVTARIKALVVKAGGHVHGVRECSSNAMQVGCQCTRPVGIPPS